MMYSNSYNNEDNYDIPIYDRCDDASIESLALSEMGSLALPLSPTPRHRHPQHPITVSKKKNALQTHFSQSTSCRTDSIQGLPSVMSYGDNDDDDDEDDITYTTASGKYNDTDLTNIMMKLRGESSNMQIHEEKADETNDALDMSEDLIAQHLKALTITTWTIRKTDQPVSSKKSVQHSTISDDISVMTYGTGLLDLDGSDDDDDADDDESEDELDDNRTAYAEVDEVMRRLNSLIRSSNNNNNNMNNENSDNRNNGKSGRELLQQLSQQGACDYENAPHTASSKKEWLARLAAELLQEGELDHEYYNNNHNNNSSNSSKNHESKHMDDDDDLGSVAMSVVEIYNHNVRLLEKEAERATQLLLQTNTAHALSTLRSQASKEHVTVTTVPRKPKPPQQQQVLHKHYTSKPVKSSMKQVPVRSSIVVPSKQSDTTMKESQLEQRSSHDKRSSSTVISKIPKTSSPTTDPAKPKTANKPKPSSSSSSSKLVHTSKRSLPEPSFQLKHRATTTKNTTTAKSKQQQYANIVIPSGLPPYPGHGPKWPWHPDSPRAPNGYKECYMLHMGGYYHQYMTYLLQRATGNNSSKTTQNEEEVLRSALSSQATFNDQMSKTTPKTVASTPTSTLKNHTIKSNGRARKNCVVPVVLTKIDEGSNSSSKASLSNGFKNRNDTTGVPDANIVGTVHPKSKGKRGTIVVVTANELDQKAKEERKLQRQQQQQLSSVKKSVPAVIVNKNNGTKRITDTVINPTNNKDMQPCTTAMEVTSTTEVDIIKHCGCTIM